MLRAVSKQPVQQVTWVWPALGVLLLGGFLAWRVTQPR